MTTEHFMVYSREQMQFEQIEGLFNQLPGAKVVWVVDSLSLGPGVDLPFVRRESDGLRLSGIDGVKWFVQRVLSRRETLSPA